jgi:seryl-tRNA synthetase
MSNGESVSDNRGRAAHRSSLIIDSHAVRYQLDQLLKESNAISKEVGQIKKVSSTRCSFAHHGADLGLNQTGGNADELMEKSKEAKKQIVEMEEKEKEVISERDKVLVNIGNIVHDSVPISQDEANNAIVKEFGTLRTEDKLYNHVDLVGLLDIVNLEAGQTVAGGRGYYLTNEGVLLNQALINYGLQFAYKRNYRPGKWSINCICLSCLATEC